MTLHHMLVRCTIVAVLATVTAQARAQDWPAKPVTMVVAAAADGPIDVFARLIAERMGPILGQRVVVSKTSAAAAGSLGGQRVAKAAPDGYTTLLGTIATHANPQLMTGKPLYDPVNDFAPVALIAEIPLVLVVRKDLPGQHIRGVRRLCQGEPGQHELRLGRRRIGIAPWLRHARQAHGHQHSSTCPIAAPGRPCRT